MTKWGAELKLMIINVIYIERDELVKTNDHFYSHLYRDEQMRGWVSTSQHMGPATDTEALFAHSSLNQNVAYNFKL